MAKIQKVFGIDYSYYAGGGSPSRKLGSSLGDDREMFFTETDMMERALELKENYLIGDIELFTTNIIKEEYELSFD